MSKIISQVLIFLIYFWHNFLGLVIAQILGQTRACRFDPPCSIYTVQAIRQLGTIKGLKLGVLRLLKCHPLAKATSLRNNDCF